MRKETWGRILGRNRGDVSAMCNLSQGIMEKGMEKGIAKGEERLILNMHKKGYTSEQIAEIAEKSVIEVEDIIRNAELVLT